MNAKFVSPSQIKKENIPSLDFPNNDVLWLSQEIKLRKSNAEAGMLLGNDYKCKVKIIFEDSESAKQVITTIWGVTDKHIILKGGITIPLHRISMVDVCA